MEVYQSCNSLDKRLNESNRILQKHPERVPIIVCKSAGCKLPDIDKQKFLVHQEMIWVNLFTWFVSVSS